MADQYEEFKSVGVEVIAVVKDSQKAAQAYFGKHNIPFHCLVNPSHSVYDQYEVKSKLLSLGQRPALFVIDKSGKVQYAYLGWQQWEIPSNKTVLKVCKDIHCG